MVKLVTPMRLKPDISKTAGDRDSVPKYTTNRKCPMGYRMVSTGSTVGYSSDSLAFGSIYKNLIHSFILYYLTFKKLQKALNSVKI